MPKLISALPLASTCDRSYLFAPLGVDETYNLFALDDIVCKYCSKSSIWSNLKKSYTINERIVLYPCYYIIVKVLLLLS